VERDGPTGEITSAANFSVSLFSSVCQRRGRNCFMAAGMPAATWPADLGIFRVFRSGPLGDAVFRKIPVTLPGQSFGTGLNGQHTSEGKGDEWNHDWDWNQKNLSPNLAEEVGFALKKRKQPKTKTRRKSPEHRKQNHEKFNEAKSKPDCKSIETALAGNRALSLRPEGTGGRKRSYSRRSASTIKSSWAKLRPMD
jgi:hypothetical protein